jgi:single-strand DNA-binding protein
MANYNRVILAGNLTRDPQLTVLPSNTPVCEFGLAVNRRWRGQDGQNREETCFVDCRLYGPQAETFNQYMSKGRSALVEGRLRLDQWETQDGQKRSKLSVVVERFQFLGSARGGSGSPQQADRAAERPSPPSQEDVPPPGGDDDIPF